MKSFLRFYFAVFFDQDYIYIIDKPSEKVERDVALMLNRNIMHDDDYNIGGMMKGNTFKASPVKPRDPGINYRRPEQSEIRGVIEKINENKTRITISTSPDFTFTLVYLFLNAGGIYLIWRGLISTIDIIALIAGFLIITAACTVIWIAAFNSRFFLKNEFERVMGITPQT